MTGGPWRSEKSRFHFMPNPSEYVLSICHIKLGVIFKKKMGTGSRAGE